MAEYLHLVRSDCPLPPQTHVVAYCRDSGGEEQDRSINQQTQVIREYCAHHGLILERLYIDEAKSASNSENRDQLNQMLTDLRYRFKDIRDRYKRDKLAVSRPFGIVFWKSNRLSRDSLESNFIKADLRMRALTIIDLITRGDTGDPGTNALLEAFQQWQDQNLLDEISQNIRRGLADVVSLRDNDPIFRRYNPNWETNDGRYLGISPGRPPTGFKTERIQIGMRERKRRGGVTTEAHIVQRLLPDKESGLWDRCYLAWKMRHEGAGIKEIMDATRLFPTAGSYTTFFGNRIYTGDFEYGGKLHVDFVPALIPREWFEKEQQLRQERAAKQRGDKLRAALEPRRIASRHLLSGLVYCGAIEGEEHLMSADTIPANAKRTQWDCYICSHKKNKRGQTCNAPRVSARALEEAVIDKLMTEVLTKENLMPIAQSLTESLNERNEDVLARINSLQSSLEEVRRSINKLMDAVEKIGLSPNLQGRLIEREAEERELLAQLVILEDMIVKPKDIPLVTEHQLDEFIQAVRQALNSEDVEVARKAVRSFVAKIVVHEKAGTIFYTFPLSDLSRNEEVPLQGLYNTSFRNTKLAMLKFVRLIYLGVAIPSSPIFGGSPRNVERKAQILILYNQGLSLREIAERFDISVQRVHQIIHST